MNIPVNHPAKELKNHTFVQKTNSDNDGLSIVIPAYNEESAIGLILNQLMHTLDKVDYPHEIIVVDDCSQDNTAAAVMDFDGVRLIQHKRNRGYGGAIKTGILHSKYDSICIIDADGTYPNERIPDLYNRFLLGCDMVVGARTSSIVSVPLIRRPAKWAIARLAQIVVGEKIADINSGMRIFKRDTVLRFFTVLPDGFSFTTTITLGMMVNDYVVEYLPINYYPRVGKSKIRPIRDTFNFIQLVLSIALYFSPLKIFLPLGGILFLLGLTWGLISALLFNRIADASTAVILMTAVQIWVVGLLADLVNRRLSGYHKFDNHTSQFRDK